MKRRMLCLTALLLCLTLPLTAPKAEERQPSPPEADAALTVGEYVTFGRYEQDNDLTDGQEPVEWLVLDVQGGKALLLARCGLDSQPYDKASADTVWEQCTLRAWLNDGFLNAAFTPEEQAAILTANADNSGRQGFGEWDTNGGSDTQDRVFLLSCAEAGEYLDVEYWTVDGAMENTKSRAEPTAYAFEQSIYYTVTEDGTPAGRWWLRSPGEYQNFAAYVGTDGSLDCCSVDTLGVCVRPAIWIDLALAPF